MKCRYLLLVSLIIILLFGSAHTSASEYTLDELMRIAEKNSSPVSSILKKIGDLKLDLELLKTNYNLKWNLNGKPLILSPDSHGEGLTYDMGGTLNASMKFPIGVEVSTSVDFLNLLSGGEDYKYSFTLKYPIYPGRAIDSTLVQIDGKNRELIQAEWNLKAKLIEAQVQTWKKFYSTLLLKERLTLAEASLQQAKADLDLYESLYSKGYASEPERLEKEISYKSNLINYERSNQQYLNSLKDLFTYVGIDPAELTPDYLKENELKGSLEEIASMELVAPEELPPIEELRESALNNSISLKEARLSLLSAEEELKRMSLANAPRVDSQFEYKPVGLERQGEKYGWTFTVSANYQFGGGGRSALELEKQRRLIDELKTAVKTAENSVIEQLETKLTNLKIAYMDYQAAELELMKTRLEYQSKEKQFEKGIISEAQFANDKRLMRTTELNLMEKRIAYQVSYWDLVQFVYLQINEG